MESEFECITLARVLVVPERERERKRELAKKTETHGDGRATSASCTIWMPMSSNYLSSKLVLLLVLLARLSLGSLSPSLTLTALIQKQTKPVLDECAFYRRANKQVD